MVPDWQSECGTVQLYRGDCLDILPGLGKVDAVITDPPYGIGFAGQPTKWQRRAGAKPAGWDDEAPPLGWLNLDTVKAIVWGGNYFALAPSRGWLCWHKPDSPPSMGDFELAWTNLAMTTKHISHTISATNRERVGHPTQKPVAVMEWCLRFLQECETILDPFMGSGTTGVACIRLGRKFIGIELEPKYFDIAVERCKKALRDKQGGELFCNKAYLPKKLL